MVFKLPFFYRIYFNIQSTLLFSEYRFTPKLKVPLMDVRGVLICLFFTITFTAFIYDNDIYWRNYIQRIHMFTTN